MTTRRMRAQITLLLIVALSVSPSASADGPLVSSHTSRMHSWVRRTAATARARLGRAISNVGGSAAVRAGALGALTASQAHADTFSRVAVAIGAPPEALVAGAVVVGLAVRRVARNRRRDGRAGHRAAIASFDQSSVGQSYNAALAAARNRSAVEGQALVEIAEAELRLSPSDADAALWRVTRALGLMASSPSSESFASRISAGDRDEAAAHSDRDAVLIENVTRALATDNLQLNEIESAVGGLRASLAARPGIGRQRSIERHAARVERALHAHKSDMVRKGQQLRLLQIRALQQTESLRQSVSASSSRFPR